MFAGTQYVTDVNYDRRSLTLSPSLTHSLFLTLSVRGPEPQAVLQVDIDRMLAATQYVTDLNYNRRYRPPEEERDPLTFNLEADNLDRMKVPPSSLHHTIIMNFFFLTLTCNVKPGMMW